MSVNIVKKAAANIGLPQAWVVSGGDGYFSWGFIVFAAARTFTKLDRPSASLVRCAQCKAVSMKNLVQINGEALDIEDLRFVLKSDNWRVTQNKDGYFLESKYLEGLTDANEILCKAREFLDMANGALSAAHSDHNKILATSVIKIKEDGTRDIYVFIDESIKMRSRLRATLSAGTEEILSHTPSTLELWVKIAETDKAAKDAIHFFNEVNWINLYKIYEIIRDDINDKETLGKLVDLSTLKLFAHNANNRYAIGDEARHGSLKRDPPKKILTLEEAYNIIK